MSFNFGGKVASVPTARSLPVCNIAGRLMHTEPIVTTLTHERSQPAWCIPNDVSENSKVFGTMVLKHKTLVLNWVPPGASKRDSISIHLKAFFLKAHVDNIRKYVSAQDNKLAQDVPLCRVADQIEVEMKAFVHEQKKRLREAEKRNLKKSGFSKELCSVVKHLLS